MSKRGSTVILLVFASRAATRRGIGRSEHAKGGRRGAGSPGLWSERGGLGACVEHLGGWRSGRLVASVVDDAREQILAASGHFLHGLFGGAVLARAGGGLRDGETRGGHGGQVVGLGGVARGEVDVCEGGIALAAQGVGTEDVGERGQTVVGLRGWQLVHVRGCAQGRALVDHMAGQWLGLVAAGEGLVERGGLDDSLVGKLGGGRGHDGEAGGSALAGLGHPHGLGGLHAVRAGVLGGSLHALFDDGALLVPDGEAALQLLAHDGIVGLEAGRQAGQTDVLERGGHGPSRRAH